MTGQFPAQPGDSRPQLAHPRVLTAACHGPLLDASQQKSSPTHVLVQVSQNPCSEGQLPGCAADCERHPVCRRHCADGIVRSVGQIPGHDATNDRGSGGRAAAGGGRRPAARRAAQGAADAPGTAAGGARRAGAAGGRLRPGARGAGRGGRRGTRPGRPARLRTGRQPGLGRGHGLLAAGRARTRWPRPGAPARRWSRWWTSRGSAPRPWRGCCRDRSARPLVAAAYGGQRGHPVLFGADRWADSRRVRTGDRGARAYLRAHEAEITLVECGDVADAVRHRHPGGPEAAGIDGTRGDVE